MKRHRPLRPIARAALAVLAAAALAAIVAAAASASQLIDRNATNVSLMVNAKKEALVTYTAGGKVHHVLAWGAINAFPTKLVWYFYYEGAFQLLDGGQLDLGIVRDSLLDSTNDYEIFSEIFETVAYRGFSGGAMQVISTLCANGGSAGTISTAGSCA